MHASVLRGAITAITEQRDQALAERDRARADARDATALAEAVTRRWLDDGAVLVDRVDELCHDYAKVHALIPISEDDLEWNE